ncbi:hypothetical protein DSD19_04655 [Rhodovulum sp. BSW8]|uniref:hypothetical protein n=1 Tax=Rhodovulum sp. BSW8 TaxID=2259645 RepID=UPI000DE475A6|nr:hypothetical protein [Rhodovulum sp. BSW8]RBO54671.1 hypothetical protein DSD19_04655 [Rhodovulum sp. BSW8]
MLTHYGFTPRDEAVGKSMASDWLAVLEPFSREEIEAACLSYLRDVPDRRPTPAAIRLIIVTARAAEHRRRHGAAHNMEQDRADRERRAQRPSPERAAELLRETGFGHLVKRIPTGGPDD